MTQRTASTGPQALVPTKIDIYDKDVWVGTTDIDSSGEWSYPASDLQIGEHRFTAKAGAVVSNAWRIQLNAQPINATVPFVVGVSPPDNERQKFDYYDVNGDIEVMVPNYNMLPGDTVKVYWKGRSITLGSDIKTVPTPLRFKISKYEVIDVIRWPITDVWYTVRRASIIGDRESPHLQLVVTGSDQEFDVAAPTLNGSKNNLRVLRQRDFNSTSTARVRAIGITEWESHSQTFESEDYLNFPIDSAWLAQNEGHSVVFNYSLRLKDDGGHFLFSQLLRVNPL